MDNMTRIAFTKEITIHNILSAPIQIASEFQLDIVEFYAENDCENYLYNLKSKDDENITIEIYAHEITIKHDNFDKLIDMRNFCLGFL